MAYSQDYIPDFSTDMWSGPPMGESMFGLSLQHRETPFRSRLLKKRELLDQALERDLRKVVSIIHNHGSRTTLKCIAKRLNEKLQEIVVVADQIENNQTADDHTKLDTMMWCEASKGKVEDRQDEITEHLESRSEEAASVVGDQEPCLPLQKNVVTLPTHQEEAPTGDQDQGPAQIGATDGEDKVVEQAAPGQPPTGIDVLDLSRSERSVGGESDTSEKKKEALIQAEVARLRVHQEKRRYEEECQLREIAHRLTMSRQEDEAERHELEANLWETASQGKGQPMVRTYPAPPTTEPELDPRPWAPGARRRLQPTIDQPRQKMITSLRATPLKEEIKVPESPLKDIIASLDLGAVEKPVEDLEEIEEEPTGDLRKFFLGIAKPQLPKFNGEKDQYHDWRAQYDIFVHRAKVPVRYKMMMLKGALTGRPLKLVENLGYTDPQYKVGLAKLEQRYGGEKRLLQRHLEAIISTPAVSIEDLKGLEELANKLCDIVAKLSEAGQLQELVGMSALYTIVLQKIPDILLIQYHNTTRKEATDGLAVFADWFDGQVCLRLDMAETKKKTGFQTKKSQKSTTLATEGSTNQPKTEKTDVVAKSLSGSKASSVAYNKPNNSVTKVCPVCKLSHKIFECKQWLKKPVKERWDLARANNLCFCCLQDSHRGRFCKSRDKCRVDGCTNTHHPHLHYTKDEKQTPAEGSSSSNNFGITHDGKVKTSKVSLRMVPVFISGDNGKRVKVNAFLDEGSDSTYVRSDLVAQLGIAKEEAELTVATLIDSGTVSSGLVILTIESLDSTIKRRVGARTLPELCKNLSVPNWRKHQKKWNHLSDVKFPKLPGRRSIDLLIGADHPELTLSLEERVGEPGEPVARKTPLGWTCIGNLDKDGSESCVNNNYVRVYYGQTEREAQLDEDLSRLWNMDAFETSDHTTHLTPDEKKAVRKTEESRRLVNGRYEVAIPWCDQAPDLPPNRDVAERRLISLEKSLAKRPQVAERYKETMNANITKGYLRKVEPHELKAVQGWYLPHFPVIREDKETTKVRIVFDSAAKKDGISLNDVMLPGPKLIQDVFDILVRFRRKAVALIGDIKEMFSQVAMAEKDQPYHRILWRDLDQSKPIETYQAVRLTFGDKASPYLAQYILRSLAEENRERFPIAAEIILDATFMDDAIHSLDTVLEGVTAREELELMLNEAGQHIRRWCSNRIGVLEGVPPEDRAEGIKLEDAELPSVKTLGVKWNAATDHFGFSSNIEKPDIYTKRTLLSKIASLFDPLQFLAPFVIRAKMVLQDAWILGLEWDQECSPQLKEAADRWFAELSQVDQVQIPRWYYNTGEIEQISLHTFTDASAAAYAAATYLRSVDKDQRVVVRLVAAKAKVTPLKTVSIPRLELMGAVLGNKLAMKVTKLLGLSAHQNMFWTDSMDVVHWLHGQSRTYKPFVANRVANIQTNFSPVQWKHVPGKINPADLATRGMTVAEMSVANTWLDGPEFLYGREDTWPEQALVVRTFSEQAKSEMSKSKQPVPAFSMATVVSEPLFEIKRFSSYLRVIRVTAWVMRFANLLQKKTMSSPELEMDELDRAERYWWKRAQRECFGETLKALGSERRHPLKDLSPFVDEYGVLRVGGRLQKSELPYESRHPVILPKRHHLTELVIRRYHYDGRHVKGVNGTLADTRVRFWIIHGREEVKRVTRGCVICRALKKMTLEQVMAPLPTSRCTASIRAFSRCGVDYGGPFSTKITRNTSAKRYLCLFTCLVTRAVHLEMAYSLDTSGFLLPFSRMVARRGKPEEMLSDNGTNFVGANRELTDLVKAMDHQQIKDRATSQGIKWTFNPPMGSHHGGVFECMIKAAKKAMVAILGSARLTDEELLTAIVETEGLLNSRPLTVCSTDPKDDSVLTPNHFLQGQCGGQLAPRVVDETAFCLRNRWRCVQDFIVQVWKRWQKEYLSALQSRNKWQKERDDLTKDDVVLLVDPSNPRGRWPLGRVLETFQGSDGHTRTVKLWSGGKEVVRPITRLVYLCSQSLVQ